MQQVNTILDGEASNSSLFSTEFNPVLKPSKSGKRNLPQIVAIEERILKIQHQLITEISIISPSRLRSTQFVKELQNHRFQRAKKSVFGESQNRIDLDRRLTLHTLTDLYEKFRLSINNIFYIILPGANQKGILYFSHRDISPKKASYLIISLRRCTFSSDLEKEEVVFQNLEKSDGQTEKMVIRDKQINIFWGYFVNHLIHTDIQFQILSNYQFTNSLHTLPHETFNGSQNREEYDHIANKKSNLLGQHEKELYHLKIQGLWLMSNLQKLIEKANSLTDKQCDVSFSTLPISETLTSQLFQNKTTIKGQNY